MKDQLISSQNQSIWNTLKLKTQMLLGYTIPVAVFAGSTLIVYTNANRVFDAFSQVETVQESIIEVDKMALAGSNMVANIRAYIFSQDREFVQLYEQSWLDFQESSQQLSQIVTDPQQMARFQQMNSIGEQYNTYAQQQINLISQNRLEESINLFRQGGGKQFLLNFLELNGQFNTEETNRLQLQNQEARSTLQNAVNLLILGAVISAISAILIAWLIASLVSEKISQAIDEITNSSRDISIAVQQQEKLTSNQVISVEETSKTMDDLEISAKQASQQAETSASGASQVLSFAQNGNRLVEDTLVEMGHTRNKVEAIAEQITRLSEQTNQIGNISQLVGDLANQTNMLALNAAVEAVRSGEHGRGFSVVAAEIRKLADESQKSAHKINTLVNEIKRATLSTVMVTEEGIKSVGNTVNLAQKTAKAFTDVSEQINNIVLNSQQISVNSKQQAFAIQQVVIATNSINENAQQSSSGMNQVKQGVHKLNNAAFDLKAIVE
ncbi:CHASE3 domain-containing protein [Spirulina subsalsa FACHB-351]|uniref:CHASE3 domain-containing protein n=1 Tax=Spirulina subsalsa FACHB-351 TaxID=234711 RepID=A0ABT3L5E2_9CYAN|nr:methyl-accepting chemotaxis protein [Spirulina subsalsa]MCW6036220.1 CHASE3 domain-containing protein [Spirulina subsalsa FACHB-351]